MAQIHWLNPISGNFTNASDWSGGIVPGAGDDAILGAPGTAPYTVTVSTTGTVNSIQLSNLANLLVTAGTFTAANGTGAGVNAGVIALEGGTSFSVSGTLDNTGVIRLQSAGNGTFLEIGASGLALTGGGSVTLSDSLANAIQGGFYERNVLTNIDNTIAGSGLIQATVTNGAAGVIDATGHANALEFGNAVVSNSGLIEATGAAGLALFFATVDGSGGGTVLVASGSRIAMSNGVLSGAALTASVGALIDETESSVVNFDNLNNAGTIRVESQSSLSVGAKLSNSGTIDLISQSSMAISGTTSNSGLIELSSVGSGNATLVIDTGGATLASGGRLILDDSSGNSLTGASSTATLVNVDNLIIGAGDIGAGSMTLINGPRA